MTRKRGDSKIPKSPASRALDRGERSKPAPVVSVVGSQRPLPPILHQPLVAISLVLVCASLAQLAAWLVSTRLPTPLVSEASSIVPSAIIANPLPFAALQRGLDRIDGAEDAPNRRPLFRTCLTLGLLSTVGWYLVSRKLLGPGWATWTAVAWCINPLFAFTAQRSTALTLVLFAVPFTFALLIWWGRSRRRRVAFVAGLAAGLASLLTPAMPLAFAAASILLFVPLRKARKSRQGLGLLWLGFAVPVITSAILIRTGIATSPADAFAVAVSVSLDNNDGSVVARAMKAQAAEGSVAGTGARWQAAWREIESSPGEAPVWLSRRAWRCLYATSDGRFQQPLFALNLFVLIPAVWGAIVCLRQRAWRWQVAAGIAMLAAFWLPAAVFEPLVRNIAPVGGMLVLLAVVAAGDLYERAFGRRLSPA